MNEATAAERLGVSVNVVRRWLIGGAIKTLDEETVARLERQRADATPETLEQAADRLGVNAVILSDWVKRGQIVRLPAKGAGVEA